MSESFYDEMEQLIGKHRQADEQKKKEEENDARFKRLEDGIGGLGALIDERIPAKPPAAANSEASAGEGEGESPSGRQDNSPPSDPEPEVNVERISHSTVPKIYAGDTEPDIVTYVDAETGETMTRKGRKKNYPTQTMVEVVMQEPELRPQEPIEESA